jgi:class 3 adenylate cyclase/tetratricopeptide (TPR) repeat protein
MSDELTLSAFLPDLLLRRLASGRPASQDAAEELLAATFFADLAGFTAMADRLAERGSQGPEQLTELLDHVFGTLIDTVLRHGGDVIRFAGDAILVIWRAADAEGLAEATHRAARCGLEALVTPLEHPFLPGVSLRLRIGIDAGAVRMVRVGGLLDRWEFVVTGQPLRGMGQAAEWAGPGELLVAEQAWQQLGAWASGVPVAEGCYRLDALRPRGGDPAPGPGVRDPVGTVGDHKLRLFIPGAVRHRTDAGMTGWLAELRPLSVLFINLPVLPGRPPPDQALLQQFVHLTQRELYRFEGAVDKLMMDDKGCTLLASFGLPPLAHEDDAERALRAGLAISAHLRVRGVRHRVGVATGRVYAGAYGHPQRREYSILGDTVNLAARLMQQARDEVLCCETTRAAVGARVELEALEPAPVKGKRLPVPRFRPVRALDGVAGVQARVDGAMGAGLVGREPERQELAGALNQLVERGQGGLLLLRGDAGIGKSALVAWLLARARDAGIAARFGSGDAIERSTPYRAWRPVIGQLVGFSEQLGLDETRAAALASLDGHPMAEPWAPLLNAVLPLGLPENAFTEAMTGQVRGENTRDLLVHMLRRASAAAPSLVVLEDAHWMDPASWALVAAAQRRVPSALLVLASRPMPGEAPEELETVLSDSAGGRCLELAGLGPDDVHELAARSLAVDELPPAVRRLLLERAEGNPLYTAELANALLALGVLRREGGRCRIDDAAGKLEGLRLPDTVQGAVTSRLDRLEPHQQLTLKVASVVGRSFPYRVTHDVHPVLEQRAHVREHLVASAQQGLIDQEREEPWQVYRFQHSITQQVAYDLLAHAQRRQIHSAVARWYEDSSSQDEASRLGRLAYHWRRAGDDDKTLHYSILAGEQASERGASKEAIHYLRMAVRLMERSPAPALSEALLRRTRIRRLLGESYAGVSESRLALQELLAALRELGRPFPGGRAGRLLRAVVELWRLVAGLTLPGWLRRGPRGLERRRIEELARVESRVADELFALTDTVGMALASLGAINHAERIGFYEPAVHAYNAIGYVAGVTGLRGLGERFLGRARSGDALAICNGHYARGLWYLGDARFEDSEEQIRAGLEHARSVGDAPAIATGISCLGTRFELVGDYGGAMRLWRELLLLADRQADERHELWATTAIGGALCMEGRVEEALDWIRRREDLLAGRDAMTAVGFHGQRAQAFLRAGEIVQAREAAELTHQYVRETGPSVFTHIKGLTGLCETLLALWELALEGGMVEPGQRREAVRACRFFMRYGRRFPVGRSRALRFAGTCAWLRGRPSAARRRWQQAVASARDLGMDYDEALARLEMARFAPAGDPLREEQLAAVRPLVQALRGELLLALELVEAGASAASYWRRPSRASRQPPG